MSINFIKAIHKAGLGSRDTYNTIVRFLIYATVILLPLFYLPFTSSVLEYNKQLLLVVTAAIGLVVWLLGVVVSGKLTVRTSPIDKGVLAVLIATIVSTVFSLTRAKSIFGLSTSLSSSLLSVAALSVFYFLAVNTLHDHGRMLRRALSLSVVLALALGLCQLFKFYILPGTFTHAQAFVTAGSFNALGLLAAACLSLFAKTTTRSSGRFNGALSVVGVVLSILVLGIINWWVLWAVALIGMLAMIAFDSLNATQMAQAYGGQRQGRFSLGRFVIPMITVVVGAFLLLVHLNIASLKSDIPVEVAPSYRLSAQVARSVMGERLIYGYGPENFSLAFDKFGAQRLSDSQLMSTKFFDAIAEAFTVAVQGGALALVALALLFWCLVQVVFRFSGAISASVARGEPAAFARESSGTLATVVALTAALFLYPFNLTLVFVWYVLLALSALIVSGDHARTFDIEERPIYSLAGSLGFMVGLVLVLTAVYFFSLRYFADVRYAHASTKRNPADSLATLSGAIDLDPANDQYLRAASIATLAFLREDLAQPASNDPQRSTRVQSLISTAVQYAQQATTVAPLESLNWNNLAVVYQSLSGLVDNVESLADQAYAKAGQLRPGDPTFDNSDGTMWLARADQLRQLARSGGASTSGITGQANDALTHAQEAFQRALDKSPSYGLAIYNLGTVYERQGKVSDAIQQLEKLTPYNADNATLMFELGLLYLRAGRKDQAYSALIRTVLLNPQHANARWYLALLLEERGDIKGALAHLYEIRKSNADNDVLNQKIAQLESGQRSTSPGRVIDSQPLQ